jgi:hypothetical protein
MIRAWMRQARHAAFTDNEENTYRILVERPEG